MVIAKYFIKNGYAVDTATDAQQAVILADNTTPNVVILELAMPKNNGLAFLQEFRSYTDWAEVPIIIYSRIPREDAGLSDDEWRKQGVAGYLYKPTKTLANLLASIENAL